MSFPIKTCVVCGEEFELRPGKPGFANRCLDCTAAEAEASASSGTLDADARKSLAEMNEMRRSTIRDMLYRKDS
jgi:hypothetical protein